MSKLTNRASIMNEIINRIRAYDRLLSEIDLVGEDSPGQRNVYFWVRDELVDLLSVISGVFDA